MPDGPTGESGAGRSWWRIHLLDPRLWVALAALAAPLVGFASRREQAKRDVGEAETLLLPDGLDNDSSCIDALHEPRPDNLKKARELANSALPRWLLLPSYRLRALYVEAEASIELDYKSEATKALDQIELAAPGASRLLADRAAMAMPAEALGILEDVDDTHLRDDADFVCAVLSLARTRQEMLAFLAESEGTEARRAKLVAGVERDYREILRRHPQSRTEQIHADYAAWLVDQSRPDEALQELSRTHPDRDYTAALSLAEAHRELAAKAEDQGDVTRTLFELSEAANAYRQAFALEGGISFAPPERQGDRAVNHLRYAAVLVGVHRFEEALPQVLMVLKSACADPDLEKAYLLVPRILACLGRWDEIPPLLREAVACFPGDDEVRNAAVGWGGLRSPKDREGFIRRDCAPATAQASGP